MNELLSRVFDELRNAWRFRWLGLLVAWCICLVGWMLVYSLPDVYKVESRVRIDTTSAIQPLVKDLTVMPDTAWQVELLIHTVLSTPNLETIARKTGLDIQATTPAAEQQLIERLRRQIKIANERSRINLYRISYSGSDAGMAQDIVQEVINIMTGMALGDDAEDTEQAIDFLTHKVADYRNRLDDIQARLTEFRKAHPELVEGRGGYLANLQTTRAVVAQMENKLKTLLKQQESLQEELESAGSTSHVIPPEQSSEVRSLDQRIARNQSELTQLLTRYTPQHPDVIRKQDIIENLRQQRSEAVARLRANPQRTSGTSSAAYGDLQRRLRDLDIEIDTLRSSIEQRTLQISVLEANSEKATGAESELDDLTREYETTKQQYETLRSRLNAAQLSQDVTALGTPLNFEIIDPPEIPNQASGPPRLLFMTVVLLAGLGAGGVFALFMSQIRPVFLTRRKLTEITGLPVLGAVSMAWNVRQRIQTRTNLAVFALAIGGLVAGYALAVWLIPIGVQVIPTTLRQQFL